jgi:hypothetical protein
MPRPGGVLRLHDLVYDFAPSEAPAVLGQPSRGSVLRSAGGGPRRLDRTGGRLRRRGSGTNVTGPGGASA